MLIIYWHAIRLEILFVHISIPDDKFIHFVFKFGFISKLRITPLKHYKFIWFNLLLAYFSAV